MKLGLFLYAYLVSTHKEEITVTWKRNKYTLKSLFASFLTNRELTLFEVDLQICLSVSHMVSSQLIQS